jgi:hypothetical protein
MIVAVAVFAPSTTEDRPRAFRDARRERFAPGRRRGSLWLRRLAGEKDPLTAARVADALRRSIGSDAIELRSSAMASYADGNATTYADALDDHRFANPARGGAETRSCAITAGQPTARARPPSVRGGLDVRCPPRAGLSSAASAAPSCPRDAAPTLAVAAHRRSR